MDYIRPEEIEQRSFEIIRSELERLGREFNPITARVIHTTADFEYADTMAFSDGAVEAAIAGMMSGANIVSDTNMIKAGIDKTRLKAFGGEVLCFVADADVAESAKQNGTTRSRVAIDKAAELGGRCIFAVGNAPTALIRICELYEAGRLDPLLVIGVPVGFVNVVESKEMLMRSDMPYITNTGRKGGSNVAAAIVNAIMRMRC